MRQAAVHGPLIALLTDFGEGDSFVGAMKGVLHARCPGVSLADLTHAIEPGDVLGGALQLRAAAPYFPPHTVFLAVVDPGVGGERRPLCLAVAGRRFVGPDNGLLWPAAAALGEPEAFELANPNYRLPEVSATFHGRDVFAPAAAALAAGVAPDRLGPPVPDPVRLEFPRPERIAGGVRGEVLWVDRFGNLITNLTPADLDDPLPGSLLAIIGQHRIPGPALTYSSVPPGEPCLVLSSGGTYEIADRDGSAASHLNAGRGDPVSVFCAPS